LLVVIACFFHQFLKTNSAKKKEKETKAEPDGEPDGEV